MSQAQRFGNILLPKQARYQTVLQPVASVPVVTGRDTMNQYIAPADLADRATHNTGGSPLREADRHPSAPKTA